MKAVMESVFNGFTIFDPILMIATVPVMKRRRLGRKANSSAATFKELKYA